MDVKRLITHFTYRIEPKPEGGFIARASDPNLPPLEAPTRFELQQKIQANISAALASEFPGLNLPAQNQLNLSFHIEHKPDGTFAIHSNDPNSPHLDGASAEEVESHFAEKVAGILGKHFLSELPPELASKVPSGDVKVFVTRNVSFGRKSSLPAAALDAAQTPAQVSSSNPATPGSAVSNSTFAINANDSSPITPARDGSSSIFRFIAALVIVLVAMYLYLHFHH